MSFVDALWDGRGMDYNHSFVQLGVTIISIIFSIFIGVSIILSVIIYILSRRQNEKLKQSLVNIQEETLLRQSLIGKKNSKLCIILDIINVVVFWMAISLESLCFMFFYTFDIIPHSVCVLGLLVMYLCGFAFQLWRQQLYWRDARFTERVSKSVGYFRVALLIQGLIFIGAIITMPVIFEGGCNCVYAQYGLPILLDLEFSTKVTRGYWLPERVCPLNEVCHLYATLPEDTMHEFFLNVQTGTNIEAIYIEVSTPGTYFTQNCQQIPFPSKIESRGQRNLFACLVVRLNSGTSYDINVFSKGKLLKTTSYTTLPTSQNQEPLRVLFGGDFGYQEDGFKIAAAVKKEDPHIILIGGDIAYDNANLNCYYSYDQFLSLFEKQFQETGRTIPFIFSVGNHDVGFNDYANYNITVSDQDGPLYFTYFPQRSVNGRVPQVAERRTFNYHLMQNILMFGLDSGYLHMHKDQVPWIEQVIQENPTYFPFAHYHVPMYPSCYRETFMSHWENIVAGKEAWVPLFDKYNFIAAFENHVHQYKRTYPLKAGQKADKGTVYFGDGSMGIIYQDCPEKSQTFIKGGVYDGLFEQAIVSDSGHYWMMISTQDKHVDFAAYKPSQELIKDSEYQQDLVKQNQHLDL